MSEPAAELRRRIEGGEAVVGVVGLGYVGLPVALAFCERGLRAIGFDTDASKVELLSAGGCYIRHIDTDRVKTAVEGGLFAATADFSRLSEADAVLICVPTPLTAQRDPDLSFVRSTAEAIARHLRPGQLIVLESTTYPGTTEDLVRGVLDASGLACGQDYFLAFSPEREDPGNAHFSTTTIPRVVGGVDAVSGDLAQRLYAIIVDRIVPVSNAATAEAAKLTENIFRAVNIALVNELKVIYERMGIDVWEVLDAAETKPFGFMRFNPGPGWGGHCIPLDPFYLSWKARELGLDTKFIELAGEINRGMPTYVISRLQDALNERGKAVKGGKLLVLGLAYKKDVGDTRESPAFQVLRRLLELGADVAYHDPHVPELPPTRAWPARPRLRSRALDATSLAEHDAVLVLADHSAVDYEFVAEHASLIVDTRGVYREPRSNVVKA